MRSARSFFEPTLYKKDLLRFWPLWVSYTVLWLFMLPFDLLGQVEYSSTESLIQWAVRAPARIVGDETGLILALFYGALCALALWSYLYNARSANQMHSLPLRREGHFFTRTATGLTFFLLPHAAIFLITALTELGCGCGWAGIGLLAEAMLWQTLLCLFFFALGTFCAMLTGHALVMPAFFALANFLVMGVAVIVDWLSTFFLYGYEGGLAESGLVTLLTPWFCLYSAFHVERVPTDRIPAGLPQDVYPYQFTGTAAIWIYTALAVILLGLALLLFRKRHLESAGDVVAVPFLRPVFAFGAALCVGTLGGGLTSALLNMESLFSLLLFMLIWTAIGYFAAKMLLEKSFRVFRSGYKGCAAALCALLVLIGTLQFDLFGVETRVPDADRVEFVHVYGFTTYPVDDADWFSVVSTDPETIEKTIAVHQSIVDDLGYIQRLENNSSYWYDDDGSYWVTEETNGAMQSARFAVTYTLKNGSTVTRYYPMLWLDVDRLSDPDSLESLITQLVNDRSAVAGLYDLDHLASTSQTVEFYLQRSDGGDSVIDPTKYMDYYLSLGYTEEEILAGWVEELPESIKVELDDQTAAALKAAVLADFEAGYLGQRYLFSGDEAMQDEVLDLVLVMDIPIVETYKEGGVEYSSTYYSHTSIALTRSAIHTLSVLKEAGALPVAPTTLNGEPIDIP